MPVTNISEARGAAVVAEFEKVTPAMAERLLEKNTNNRPLSQSLVDRYAAEMRRGAWDEKNGETIKIAADGQIIDGQHRLWAIFESGVTLKLLVVRNVDKQAFKTIDAGKPRSTGDIVGIAGLPNSNQIAAGAVMVLAYKRRKITAEAPIRSRLFLRSEVVQFCAAHGDALQASRKAAMGHGCGNLLGSGILIGCHYLFSTQSKHPQRGELADEFFRQLGTGLFDASFGDAKGHPIRVLRERLLANRNSVSRLQPGTLVAFVVKAWNAYAKRRAMSVLRMAKGETFPVVV